MFDKIKQYYDSGLWSIVRLKKIVGKVLSPQEFEKITGQVYTK